MNTVDCELVRSQVAEIVKRDKPDIENLVSYLDTLRQAQVQPQIVTLVGQYIISSQDPPDDQINMVYRSH